jgi:hypothetical protein
MKLVFRTFLFAEIASQFELICFERNATPKIGIDGDQGNGHDLKKKLKIKLDKRAE